MNSLRNLILAVAMMFSIVFIGDLISSNGNLSAQAQQSQGHPRRKGLVRRGYYGGRWVVRRTWNGTRWVTRKVWVGTKWTGRKTWRMGRKITSRSKKVVY